MMAFYLFGAMLARYVPRYRRWYGDALMVRAGEWLRDAERGLDESLPGTHAEHAYRLSIACAYVLAGAAWDLLAEKE